MSKIDKTRRNEMRSLRSYMVSNKSHISLSACLYPAEACLRWLYL